MVAAGVPGKSISRRVAGSFGSRDVDSTQAKAMETMKLGKSFCSQKSETRMTASVLKQDPNTSKIQKNAYLL